MSPFGPDSIAHATIIPSIPLAVRLCLFSFFGAAVLVALVIGVMFIAGGSGKPAPHGRHFLLAASVALAVQGGYLIGPFALGRTWWLWAFVWMLPVVLFVLIAASVPVLGAIRWTRPAGASGWKTIAEVGWATVIGVAVYGIPPFLLWLYRPAATP